MRDFQKRLTIAEAKTYLLSSYESKGAIPPDLSIFRANECVFDQAFTSIMGELDGNKGAFEHLLDYFISHGWPYE